MKKISIKGLDLIKQFEGCRLKAYRCPANVLTIGWGHTGDVKEGQVITQEQADRLLELDVLQFEVGVNNLVQHPINQNQFDALVSFAYNCGVGALSKSTLLKYVNLGRFEEASNELPKWNKGGGKVLQGLITRRKKERDLFLTPFTESPPVKPTEVLTPTTPPPAKKALELKVGSKGAKVKSIQRFLGIKDDGIFGKITKENVIRYQKMRGLLETGIVTEVEWGHMFEGKK